MKRNNKKGFTIVELVVVIAVIAILAAVLIPTFSNVTKNANAEANKADAKAAYTEYIAVSADYLDDDFIVKSTKGGDKYYAVIDGKFDAAKVADTLLAAQKLIDNTFTGTESTYVADTTYTNIYEAPAAAATPVTP